MSTRRSMAIAQRAASSNPEKEQLFGVFHCSPE